MRREADEPALLLLSSSCCTPRLESAGMDDAETMTRRGRKRTLDEVVDGDGGFGGGAVKPSSSRRGPAAASSSSSETETRALIQSCRLLHVRVRAMLAWGARRREKVQLECDNQLVADRAARGRQLR
ncbi:Os09g0379000 [Oryza sativa Japonica Group]|uniref:Uncharacterized protein n=3 Tax=Oryza TaxID=4527 RepID=A3BYB7_ORYSJ|nr:hypothetical protein OsJ_29176 [Oryza sativa Japonica Group]BAD26077.1 hypothetical protein [Oryza sativa Japonica Group]BAD26311.1 hypothetical protein [Oryza sativa Japonica Group]BAT07832.1 Os09g0379000 [Oryza sativa Japonica Group]